MADNSGSCPTVVKKSGAFLMKKEMSGSLQMSQVFEPWNTNPTDGLRPQSTGEVPMTEVNHEGHEDHEGVIGTSSCPSCTSW